MSDSNNDAPISFSLSLFRNIQFVVPSPPVVNWESKRRKEERGERDKSRKHDTIYDKMSTHKKKEKDLRKRNDISGFEKYRQKRVKKCASVKKKSFKVYTYTDRCKATLEIISNHS